MSPVKERMFFDLSCPPEHDLNVYVLTAYFS